MNSFNDTINALNGSGTVDITSGGASTLTLGNDASSGVFSGIIKNTSGTLGITKNGTNTQSLVSSNSYTGATTINAGTLKVTDRNALGAGASALTVSSVLDVATNIVIASIAGSGSIANNSTTTTNAVIVQSTSTFAGSIVDGSGGGGLSLLVNGGTLRLDTANSFSGGSIVASGAGLRIGNVGSMGSGGILASNNSVVGLANANNPAGFFANTITTVDNATLLFTGGGNQANNFGGQFVGSVTATNVLTNSFTISSTLPFGGFNGTVIVAPSASVRIGGGGAPTSGGENATFDCQGGNLFCRDGSTVFLGALQGGSPSSGLGRVSNAGFSTWIIGGKGLSTVFSVRSSQPITSSRRVGVS